MEGVNDPYGRPKSEEIKKLREMCRTNLKFLCVEILGMDKWDDTLHDDMQNFIEQSKDFKLILIPRGHLKSSVITVGWVIQQILIDPNISILIRNAVWDLARDFLKQISNYLSSPVLVEIFGAFNNGNCAWTKDAIEIAQKKTLIDRQPTISTAGIETALTGKHFRLIVDDDLVGQQNTGTKEQIQKVIQMFNDSENLLNSDGRHVVIGTRWHNKDLYGHLLETDTATVNLFPINGGDGIDGWRNAYQRSIKRGILSVQLPKSGRFSAYIRRAEENHKVIFSKEYCMTDKEQELFQAKGIKKKSLETLKRNPAQYAAQMSNDPLDDDLIEFKREWFIKSERNEQVMRKLATVPTIVSIDPAFRLKQTNDFAGICVTKPCPEGTIYVLEAKQVKLNASNLVDEIFRLVNVYKPQKVLIETVSAQILLVDLLKNEMKKRKVFFTIEEVKTSTTETKAMKIRGLVSFYSNGCIYHLGNLVDLEGQLLEFPRGTHDDIIDALSQQIPYWKFQAQKQTTPAEKEFTFKWWADRAHRPKNGIQQLFQDLKGM